MFISCLVWLALVSDGQARARVDCTLDYIAEPLNKTASNTRVSPYLGISLPGLDSPSITVLADGGGVTIVSID